MDGQVDAKTFFNRIEQRGTESAVVQPKQAQTEQAKQVFKVHEAEIEELKQSLRYVEIQLARARDEKDNMQVKINEQQQELEKNQEAMAKQVKINQKQAQQISELQRRIDAFNSSQKDVAEKNRFKASSYMTEINQREEELGKIRTQLMNMQDEMKLLTVSREQFRQQREVLSDQVNERDVELDKLRKKVEEQNRMLDQMCMAHKYLTMQNPSLQGTQALDDHMQQAKDDIERAERIARSTNKSSFMSLSDKRPKLASEDDAAAAQDGQFFAQNAGRGGLGFPPGTDSYINDETVPAEVFSLVNKYREKLSKIAKQQTQASLLLDDFFGEIHRVLRDQHMREIAKIRNEHSVEIMRLRKNLDLKLGHNDRRGLKDLTATKENFQAFQANDKFIENEIERQRRALLEENEILKSRLRAVDTIAKSSNQERAKFMEGASWIAKKAHVETEKHINKVLALMMEYQRKAKECVIDESIAEVKGRDVLKLNKWIQEEVDREIQTVGERFEQLFENVNFHLREATKTFVPLNQAY